MSVAIRKIEGVESVQVSLNEGVADIKLKPGNRLNPEQIRRVVRDNGFTPKGAELKVAGRISVRAGQRLLEVSGSDLSFFLKESPDAKDKLDDFEATDEEVIVTGHLAETPAEAMNEASLTLEVRRIIRRDQ